jgi:hypothetical protein
MKSENSKNLLYDYVNSLLSDDEKAEFEKQLARSVDLQNELKRVKQYYSLVKSSEPSVVPRNFIEKIHHKIGIFNDLPDNGLSPAPSACSSYDKRSVSVGLQIESKKNSPLQSRFKNWFPFEIAGVLATVAILVFIFIPNINIPDRAKKTVYDDTPLQEFEQKTIVTENQQPQETNTPLSEADIPKPVVKSDNKVAAANDGLSDKYKEEKKSIPKKTVAQSPVKGMIAKENVSPEIPASASPVLSASPSSSGSIYASTKNEEMTVDVASDLQMNESPAPVKSSSRTGEPIRIIMNAAELVRPESIEPPSSVVSEMKLSKARRFDRVDKKSLKAGTAESDNAVERSTDANYVPGTVIHKSEIEAMLSEIGVDWKCVLHEDSKLLYSLKGSSKAIMLIVNKLSVNNFSVGSMPDFSNDSVTVELELNY